MWRLYALVTGLAAASLDDLRTGEVRPLITDGLLVVGAAAYLTSRHDVDLLSVNLLVLGLVLLWYRAKFLGGADVKLMCALCLLSPLRVRGFAHDGINTLLPALLPFPVAVLVLAVLLAQAIGIVWYVYHVMCEGQRPVFRRRDAPLGMLVGAILFIFFNGDVTTALVPVLIAAITALLMLFRLEGLELHIPLAPFLFISTIANLVLGDPFSLALLG
ncbi:MAG: hypothetical protein QGG50_03530 [Methanopyri archaeon]|nr:hypothetical protein [Methanopyri archaeon]